MVPPARGVVRTDWRISDIWLRRAFSLADTKFTNLHLVAHHDEDAVVYLNGQKVEDLPGFEMGYGEFEASEALRKAIKPGENVLAVHCTAKTRPVHRRGRGGSEAEVIRRAFLVTG